MRQSFFILLLLFSTVNINAQSMPSVWAVIDEHTIASGTTESTGFYDITKLEELRLYFDQSNYWTLLTNNYKSKTEILATLVYKGVTYDSVGVRFKGQTSYLMANGQKKSFNISMDYIKNNKIDGYKTLNINNAFSDPSMMKEVLYYALVKSHTEALKSNFIRLYINDTYWGLYNNTQQPNKDFIEEWYTDNDGINMRADSETSSAGPGGGPGGPGGMWGDGTAALNFLGNDTTEYQKYYTLKTSNVENTWEKLVSLTNALNNYSGNQLKDTIINYLNIDKVLWHLACEIAFGDDDSYIYKGKMDYYIYYDQVSKLWTTYDYDANSTFLSAHTTWSPFYNETKVNYPLLNKLLAIPEFRQRYLAYMRTIINDSFGSKATNLINQFSTLIQASVFEDTKKLSSNSGFSTDLTNLSSFLSNRKAYLMGNDEVKRVGVAPDDVSFSSDGILWGKVSPNSKVVISAEYPSKDVKSVYAYIHTNLNGKYTKIILNDSGTDGDTNADDGIYSATIPNYSIGTLVSFYLETIKNDDYNTATYFPSGAGHHMYFYNVEGSTTNSTTVVINELMPSNSEITDEFDETEDWIELYNTTNDAIDLSGYYISDKQDNLQKFQFKAGTIIEPNGYLIVWADEDGSQGDLHANFKLSAEGEIVILSDSTGAVLDSYAFVDAQQNKTFARKPNGTGNFEISEPTFGTNNNTTATADDNAEAEFWKIYPNPVSNTLTVAFSKPSANLSIYTLDGKLMFANTSFGQNIQVDVTEFPSGLYIVKLDDQSKKLMISR
ncbi:MAG: CotH kinase family protein [Saprospiraceae bacterium]